MFGKNKDSQLGKDQAATLSYAAKVAGQQI